MIFCLFCLNINSLMSQFPKNRYKFCFIVDQKICLVSCQTSASVELYNKMEHQTCYLDIDPSPPITHHELY